MPRSTPPLSVGFRTRHARSDTCNVPASSTRSGAKRMALPSRAATMLLGLSKSHWCVTPPKYCAARTSERIRLAVVCSSTSSAHIARECLSRSTKQ